MVNSEDITTQYEIYEKDNHRELFWKNMMLLVLKQKNMGTNFEKTRDINDNIKTMNF